MQLAATEQEIEANAITANTTQIINAERENTRSRSPGLSQNNMRNSMVNMSNKMISRLLGNQADMQGPDEEIVSELFKNEMS